MKAVKQALDGKDILNRGRFSLSFEIPTAEHHRSPTSPPARSPAGTCTPSACIAACVWTSVRPIARWARRWIRRAAASTRCCRSTRAGWRWAIRLSRHIDRCLGCLNCQTACPSGVQYGHLLETTRAQIEQNYQRPWLQRKLREHFYGSVLPSFGKLARAAKLLRFYQRSGLQSLARATGVLKALGVAELDELSPRIESSFSFSDLGKVFPAEGERRGRVALLIGCVSSVAFAELNRATIRVLTKNGIEVSHSRSAELLRRAACPCRIPRSGAGPGPQEHRCHARPGVRCCRQQRRRLRRDHEGIRRAAGARCAVRRAGARSSPPRSAM